MADTLVEMFKPRFVCLFLLLAEAVIVKFKNGTNGLFYQFVILSLVEMQLFMFHFGTLGIQLNQYIYALKKLC